jgi:hypothetical protein
MASNKSFVPTPTPTFGAHTSPLTHLPAYVCNTDPDNCGCPNFALANYNGTINTTITVKACVMWEDEGLNIFWETIHGGSLLLKFPDVGLKGHILCRNPRARLCIPVRASIPAASHLPDSTRFCRITYLFRLL